jgi:hypothetical protein
VTGKEEADDQPHQAINGIREALKRIHLARLLGLPGDVKILSGTGYCHPERSDAKSKDL